VRSLMPLHGDVWERTHTGDQFSVMHVCGHHDPPHVTGYWHDAQGVNPCLHASFPLPRFLAGFEFIRSDDSASERTQAP
jgi:hypothetical protein